MNTPAEIRRSNGSGADVVVARGPLVIMAHGLMALHPSDRQTCWIASAAGDLSASEAEQVLSNWLRRAPGNA